MIVEARKVQTLDVEVDPVTVIVNLFDSWRQISDVPYAAELKAGYWVLNGEQKRLATREEIETVAAFKEVARIAAEYSE